MKKEDLIIKPLKNFKKEPRTLYPPIPDPRSDEPFLWLVSAKCGSGKSVMVSNLLKNIYNKYFDKVFFASSNCFDNEIKDKAYYKIHIHEDRLYDHFDDDLFDTIKAEISIDLLEDDSQHFLLVIDDLANSLTQKNARLIKNFLKHRHINLSIIIITQQIRLLNTSLRTNASHLTVFQCENKKERNSLSEMVDLSEEEFYELLDYATSEKYNFLFVDLRKNPTEFYKNFTENIY